MSAERNLSSEATIFSAVFADLEGSWSPARLAVLGIPPPAIIASSISVGSTIIRKPPTCKRSGLTPDSGDPAAISRAGAEEGGKIFSCTAALHYAADNTSRASSEKNGNSDDVKNVKTSTKERQDEPTPSLPPSKSCSHEPSPTKIEKLPNPPGAARRSSFSRRITLLILSNQKICGKVKQKAFCRPTGRCLERSQTED